MEAELVRELPTGEGWQYEPKWDGFRGVLENDGGELALWSRNERPLLRYFPELRAARRAASAALRARRRDRDRPRRRARLRLDADAAASGREPGPQARRRDPGDLHRVRPAPLGRRRRCTSARSRSAARSCSGAARASGSRPRPREARRRRPRWLDRFEAAGLDGVIAKRLDAAVPPRLARGGRQGEGAQDGRLRRRRRALEASGPTRLATLLLGLYREDGELDYVGSAAVGARNHDEIAALV